MFASSDRDVTCQQTWVILTSQQVTCPQHIGYLPATYRLLARNLMLLARNLMLLARNRQVAGRNHQSSAAIDPKP